MMGLTIFQGTQPFSFTNKKNTHNIRKTGRTGRNETGIRTSSNRLIGANSLISNVILPLPLTAPSALYVIHNRLDRATSSLSSFIRHLDILAWELPAKANYPTLYAESLNFAD